MSPWYLTDAERARARRLYRRFGGALLLAWLLASAPVLTAHAARPARPAAVHGCIYVFGYYIILGDPNGPYLSDYCVP